MVSDRIYIRQDLYPTSYINEQGEPAGYDIDVIKKIDELLPEYEFEYEAVSQEALLTGLDTGKYKAAVAGFYSNDDRRAKYLFPEECIGGNIIGLAVRKSDEADIKTLEDVATNKKSVVPIAPTSGMYGIVVEYNNEHPDNRIDLVDAEWTNAADEYKWVADGSSVSFGLKRLHVLIHLQQLKHGVSLTRKKQNWQRLMIRH